MAEKFTISLHDNGYYCVSIPNYSGGNVVRAEDYDQQVSQNDTQAENIRHLQEQYRVMKEAVENAIDFVEAIGRDIHYVYSPEAAATVQCAADSALGQLREAVTPKGEPK